MTRLPTFAFHVIAALSLALALLAAAGIVATRYHRFAVSRYAPTNWQRVSLRGACLDVEGMWASEAERDHLDFDATIYPPEAAQSARRDGWRRSAPDWELWGAEGWCDRATNPISAVRHGSWHVIVPLWMLAAVFAVSPAAAAPRVARWWRRRRSRHAPGFPVTPSVPPR